MILLRKLYERKIYIILFVFFLSSLAGCNLRAAYSRNGSDYNFLKKIHLKPLNTTEGADFYNHFLNILPFDSEKLYDLDVKISFVNDSSLIQKNADILRETIRINVSYSLQDKKTEKIIHSGSFSRLSSFNTASSPYSNKIKREETKINLSIISAEEVRNRILLNFANRGL